MSPSSSAVLDRALNLLALILADRGRSPIGAIAKAAGLPQSTAYRLVAALVEHGLVVGCGSGRYLAGGLMMGALSDTPPRAILSRVGAAPLDRIAKRFGHLAHLGVFEGGMVTYLVKAGAGAAAHFTREGMQLEAYCSGVGKILLAHLPPDELRTYLSSGPFFRLTEHTIIDPEALERHLDIVRMQNYAVDDREFADNLKCVAVPVRDHGGRVVAAVSMSAPPRRMDAARLIKARGLLMAAAADIESRLYPWRRADGRIPVFDPLVAARRDDGKSGSHRRRSRRTVSKG